MVANNTLCNASAYLKKLFLICGSKQYLICRMTHWTEHNDDELKRTLADTIITIIDKESNARKS